MLGCKQSLNWVNVQGDRHATSQASTCRHSPSLRSHGASANGAVWSARGQRQRSSAIVRYGRCATWPSCGCAPWPSVAAAGGRVSGRAHRRPPELEQVAAALGRVDATTDLSIGAPTYLDGQQARPQSLHRSAMGTRPPIAFAPQPTAATPHHAEVTSRPRCLALYCLIGEAIRVAVGRSPAPRRGRGMDRGSHFNI
jgi:hypothetical protein